MLLVMHPLETTTVKILVQALLTFYLSLLVGVNAADERVLGNVAGSNKGYAKGDLVPVSCLNRTMYVWTLVPRNEAQANRNGSVILENMYEYPSPQSTT